MTKQIEKMSWGGYISPSICSVEISTEGILCASTDAFSISDWEKDNDSLNF